MKLFVVVLVAATLIGGFVGGELSETTFSLLGAVVGGVGTGAVLLSLGAYFHAQDEKRKRQSGLSPEMRAVFDRTFGSPAGARAAVAATAKWRPRPFHENKSKAEYTEWFANAPGWKNLDPRLIQLLIKRLYGNPMFEVFVHASQDCEVVHHYERLKTLFDKRVGDVAALPRVADLLSNAGVIQGKQCAELMLAGKANKQIERLYMNALNACEAAIHVEPRYFPGYLHMAELRNLVGKTDDAMMFCKQGLEQIQRAKAIPVPKAAELDELETALSSMLKELRASN